MGGYHTGTFPAVKPPRKVYMDVLRVIATVFVICVHTVALAKTTAAPGTLLFRVLEVFNYTFLSCNLFFVMISGALLLPVKRRAVQGFFCAPFYPCLHPTRGLLQSVCLCQRGNRTARSVAVGTDAAAVLHRTAGGSAASMAGVRHYLAVCAHPVFAVSGAEHSRSGHERRDACDLPSECVCHLCATVWRYAAGGTLRYCEFVCGGRFCLAIISRTARGSGQRIFSLRRVLCHI